MFTTVIPSYLRATTFAVIGNFDDIGPALVEVSSTVNSWRPDFITIFSDNDDEDNYTKSVLPYFSDFIKTNCDSNAFSSRRYT